MLMLSAFPRCVCTVGSPLDVGVWGQRFWCIVSMHQRRLQDASDSDWILFGHVRDSGPVCCFCPHCCRLVGFGTL